MISLPNPTNKMTLTNDQLRSLIAAYAQDVVDSMDVRDLCAFAIDTISDNMDGMSEIEVLDEMSHYYDEDVLNELIESVTND